jgi:hypothetical protein
MTYFGPIGEEDGDCSVLLDYFAKLGSHLKPNQNPAEFILEVTGAGIPKTAKQIKEKPKDGDDGDQETQKPAAVCHARTAVSIPAFFESRARASREETATSTWRPIRIQSFARTRCSSWKRASTRSSGSARPRAVSVADGRRYRSDTHTHTHTHSTQRQGAPTHQKLTIVVGSRSRRE